MWWSTDWQYDVEARCLWNDAQSLQQEMHTTNSLVSVLTVRTIHALAARSARSLTCVFIPLEVVELLHSQSNRVERNSTLSSARWN